MKKPLIKVHPNAVIGERHNARILVRPTIKQDDVIIDMTIMDGGTQPRTIHWLSHKDKAVNTGIKLTKEGAEILYQSLAILLNDYDTFKENEKFRHELDNPKDE